MNLTVAQLPTSFEQLLNRLMTGFQQEAGERLQVLLTGRGRKSIIRNKTEEQNRAELALYLTIKMDGDLVFVGGDGLLPVLIKEAFSP